MFNYLTGESMAATDALTPRIDNLSGLFGENPTYDENSCAHPPIPAQVGSNDLIIPTEESE